MKGIYIKAYIFVCLLVFLTKINAADLAQNQHILGKEPILSKERIIFQTKHGDIEFGLFPKVAPATAEHIFKLIKLGAYSGNVFFRIDKGFVAQCSDVMSRKLPLNEEQRAEASRNVPLEVVESVRHVAGVLSMGRYDDPNSGTSSFSILLGSAPHLDMHYTIFGRVTKGMETLRKMEELPTRQEGIFVMPLEPVVIESVYWRRESLSDDSEDLINQKLTLPGNRDDSKKFSTIEECQAMYSAQSVDLQRTREKCLPH